MALPKLNTPTYELELPSTGEKIKYRPFLVKEQKVLMMAQDSGEDEQIANVMSTLVSDCTFGSVNSDNVPMFDVEYIFLRIRGKSVGEIIELNVLCPDDDETRVPVSLNLDDVDVTLDDNHTNEISITPLGDVKIIFRYPILADMKNMISTTTNVEMMYSLLTECIQEIHHGDDVYNKVDMTNKEIEEFIDSLTTDQFKKITNFFNTMPKLRHIIEVTNPKTGVKSEVVLEGLQSFLE